MVQAMGDDMPDNRREDMVRTPTRTIVTACTLSAALAVTGCGADDGDKAPESGGEVGLQPAGSLLGLHGDLDRHPVAGHPNAEAGALGAGRAPGSVRRDARPVRRYPGRRQL
jgi:hypothetical protein